jgi:acetylornithine/succinyldiaminopimelate/putrescine aminotransferase
VTWDPHYREPFAPLVPDVKFANAAEPWLLDAIVDESTAAIIVEPVQGEGGVRPISRELVTALHAARERTGALLIADEVQAGCGRTGMFLGSQLLGLEPDLVALGKALGAGIPVGAAVLKQRVADAVSPGDHGTTYGGNLLACRAALVFLDQLEGGLQASMRRLSVYLAERLRDLATRHADKVREVRGAGLLAALDLTFDAAPIVSAALERGLVVNRTATSVIRMLPPYIVTESDVDEAVGILLAALTSTAAAKETGD